MRAVVVYESMFGDTRQIADAIGDGLALKFEVTVVPVSEAAADQLDGIDLLVVGGPTHVRGMSRPKTREGAVDQASQPDSGIILEPGASGLGLREWFSTLTEGPPHAAAFDTRVQMSTLVTGRAAPRIARSLQRSGCHLIAEPESFLVTTKKPTLVAGQRERARAWGETLAVVGARQPNKLGGLVDG
ncbi:flavodoxin domain-containing protein [Jatrophihabitans sp. DSM 45814]